MFNKPNYIEKFGDYYLLWFEQSNTYSCIDAIFFTFLDIYLTNTNLDDFSNIVISNYNQDEDFAKNQYNHIKSYLAACNSSAPSETTEASKNISSEKNTHHKFYRLNSKTLQIGFNNLKLIDIIHPIIAHLEVEKDFRPELTLNISLTNNKIILFGKELYVEYEKSEYHKLQGKVLMCIINLYHGQQDKDWIGLFHASSVVKNENALMLFGPSGSGKSTLTSLLAGNGFDLLADDMVPLKAEDHKIYRNPSAVSIKKGSMKNVEKYWPNINSYTKGIINKGKGEITYIPMHRDNNLKGSLCKHLIKVNYIKESKTKLAPLDFKTALEILIPETWLFPSAPNAKAMFQWLKTVSFFELTYSNYEETIPLLEELIH